MGEINWHNIKRTLYIISLGGIAFFLPLSEFMTTVFIIMLIISYFLSFSSVSIKRSNINYLGVSVFVLSYLVYVLWMLNTSDVQQGLHDIRLKLPLLLLPVIMATSRGLSESETRVVLFSFVAGVLITTFSGIVFRLVSVDENFDPRNLSPFISHIRLSLMICLSIFIVWFYTPLIITRPVKSYFVSSIIILWFGAFMVLMASLTGLVILVLCTWLLVIIETKKLKSLGAILFSIIVPVVIIISASILLFNFYTRFNALTDKPDIDDSALTLSGNAYTHYPERQFSENGHYVWRYICESELKTEWNRISDFDYNGYDKQGHEIRFTIIRYLTAKGMRKDSAALSLLNRDEISLIENGYANPRYLDGTGIKDRLEELAWQIDYYSKGGNPEGHTVTQRVEFFKTGLHIFKRFPFFGTGTGDLRDQFAIQYDIDNSELSDDFRLLSHNQYLSSLVSFGIVGFVIFWFALIAPIFLGAASKNKLFIIFLAISFLSMINEDTLETHTGVTFFAFFYSLFLFAKYGDT
jgi:hypothetical protein